MWTRKFGQLFAHNLRKSRLAPSARWHLDEMVVRIGGKRMFLWRAVDDEGEVLDMLVQKRRNKAAALKLFHHLQHFQRPTPSHSRCTLGYLRAEAMATWVAATASA